MANIITTMLSIGGVLNPSLNTTFSAANRQLAGLQKHVARTNATLMGLGRNFVGMMAGFLAFQGISAMMTTAIKKTKEEQGAIEALNTVLSNNRLVRRMGADEARKEVSAIRDQAEAMQKITGIQRTIYEQGAATLSMYGFTGRMIMKTTEHMKDFGALLLDEGKTAEDIKQTYDAIGKAIQTGMGRGLKGAGIELDVYSAKMLQIYSSHHQYAQAAELIFRVMDQRAKGAAARRAGTMMGKRDIAVAEMMDSLRRMGEPLIAVQARLTTIFAKIVPTFAPYIVKFFNWLDWKLVILASHMDSGIIPTMKRWLNEGWKKLSDALRWWHENSGWLVPRIIEWTKWIAIAIVAFKGLSIAVNVVKTAMSALAVIPWVANLNPWILAITALVGLGVVLYNTWKPFRDLINDIGKNISEFFVGTKATGPTTHAGPHGTRITEAGQAGRPPGWKGWLDTAIKEWNKFVDSFDPDTKKAIENIKQGWQDFANWFTTVVWQPLIKALPSILAKVMEILGVVRGVYLTVFKTAIELAIKGISKLIDLARTLPAIFDRVNDWLKNFGPNMKKVAGQIGDWFHDMIFGKKRRSGIDDPGLIGHFKKAWEFVVSSFSELMNWVKSFSGKIWDLIIDYIKGLWTGFWTWIELGWNTSIQNIQKQWSDFTDSIIARIKSVEKPIIDFILSPITNALDAWNKLFGGPTGTSMTPFGTGTSGGAGATTSGYPAGRAGGQTTSAANLVWRPVYTPSLTGQAGGADPYLRGLSVGLISGDNPRTQGGAFWSKHGSGRLATSGEHRGSRELLLNDLSISPDLLGRYPYGSFVDIVDKQGRVLYAHQRIADPSFWSKNRPTHGVFEQRHIKDFPGGAYLRRSSNQQPDARTLERETGRPDPPHINSPVTIHIHGNADEKVLAEAHRRHIDHLERSFKEVAYREARKDFRGA